ncbi:hypothetical protein WER98_04720 [Staphylococcus pseudintermedius]|nr:hypothetical protein [Staphylococcus pseudintermedius]MDT0848239.1 hypothetical protein [Staphylococcus pseudintermedius]
MINRHCAKGYHGMLMFMTMRKLKRTAMNAITSVDLYESAH